jgi:GTP-binding protein YchF
MKVGLVGYQGSGKSTVFQLLTGTAPDVSKINTGQLGVSVVPDQRFDRLVELYKPKKESPAQLELFDTPGLSRDQQSLNAQRLSVIREATALVQVIGCFSGCDPIADIKNFEEELILADLEVVNNRIKRLKKDVTKPRPDREQLARELEALLPIAAELESGNTLRDFEFNEAQASVVKSFALLTQKKQLALLNTSESEFDEAVLSQLNDKGLSIVTAPIGLELEVQELPEDERAEFAVEMGLKEPSRNRVLQAIFEVTDQICFFTCADKEVHVWILKRGATALDAADTIHSDLARGFIRAEVMAVADLLRLGSEREVKAAGLQHVVGKEYIVQDGDEIVIRSGI